MNNDFPDADSSSISPAASSSLIKDYLFTKELAPQFFNFVALSPNFDIVLNHLFAQFKEGDWINYKKEIYGFMLEMSQKQKSNYSHKVSRLNIDYKILAPLLKKDDWERYLSLYTEHYNSQFTKLEPYFLKFVEKNSSSDLMIKYCGIKFSKKEGSAASQEIIELFKTVNITQIDKSKWVEFLGNIHKFGFSHRLKLIEHFDIDPTYSADAFISFLNYSSSASNNRFHQSFGHTSYRYTPERKSKLSLDGLHPQGLAWFLNKIESMDNSQLDSFFENKFNIQYARKNLMSQDAISALSKSDFKSNKSLLQDYVYLISFCNLILNPSNQSQAAQLAVSLNGYIESKMVNKASPWWKKVQEIINKENLRKFLYSATSSTATKEEWMPIYEKVALDSIVLAKSNNANALPSKRNKI